MAHHHHEARTDKGLWVAVSINLLLTFVQVVGGVISGSLSLIADALHNLSDAASLGIALFAKGNNEAAISHYKMAIKLNPYFTNAHYNLGYALLQKGEMKEAVHHFRETLRLKSNHVSARDYLEIALLKLQAID